ncbi:hypothetical protein [Pantoea ananatis]|uniref:hypothetical protein n=1 Tax=Pantoea ananas TaxID=553 RepID=UPI0015750DCD|nr:hypothetical protein [Pantoea ananatis]NQE76871.1 hypothetical protein [Pantoea ananatis]NQE81507.1 hypothetical protein [Pantoea ananatis]
MTMDSNREGCEIGEREHKRKIDELEEEARNIRDHAENGSPDASDQERLDDIQTEVNRRKHEINRMK